MQVYDLAWSPTGEYIIAGSTDNTARVFAAVDGKCVYEIAEHSHYVQGVAWDPLNEYIATQSSDRSMHVYRISSEPGGAFEAHAVGKNTRMPQSRSRRHSRTPSASPSTFSTSSRYGRSPSPMPALPAIRSLPSPSWSNLNLYGDESWTNFFRRLTFSPDGGLLLTPAGQFEDPAVVPGLTGSPVKIGAIDDNPTPPRGRKGHPSTISSTTAVDPLASTSSSTSTSSVYIYSRANFARPPIAQLPGHKKASVAVRFSPILYELRPGVTTFAGEEHHQEQATPKASLEKGADGWLDVDVLGPSSGTTTPSPRPALLTSGISQSVLSSASPMLSPMDIRPPTPAASKPPTPVILPQGEMSTGTNVVPTASIFSLPYRMLFAVVTMDTVAIYDTQQAGPVCMLTKLHYDEFTDLTWYALSTNVFGPVLILSNLKVSRWTMSDALLSRWLLYLDRIR